MDLYVREGKFFSLLAGINWPFAVIFQDEDPTRIS
jgi:hypothetical protein